MFTSDLPTPSGILNQESYTCQRWGLLWKMQKGDNYVQYYSYSKWLGCKEIVEQPLQVVYAWRYISGYWACLLYVKHSVYFNAKLSRNNIKNSIVKYSQQYLYAFCAGNALNKWSHIHLSACHIPTNNEWISVKLGIGVYNKTYQLSFNLWDLWISQLWKFIFWSSGMLLVHQVVW
jgi:hypothetical protein